MFKKKTKFIYLNYKIIFLRVITKDNEKYFHLYFKNNKTYLRAHIQFMFTLTCQVLT